jgi:hypothetical protein
MFDRIILHAGGSVNHFNGTLFKNKNSWLTMKAWYLHKQNIYLVTIDGIKDLVYKLVPREYAPIKYFKLKNYLGHKNGYKSICKGLNCYNLTFEEANELLYNEKE